MNEAILIADVHSVLKDRELYGMKGDKVKIISEHGNVMIVEGAKRIIADSKKRTMQVLGKHRYPVSIKKLNALNNGSNNQ